MAQARLCTGAVDLGERLQKNHAHAHVHSGKYQPYTLVVKIIEKLGRAATSLRIYYTLFESREIFWDL